MSIRKLSVGSGAVVFSSLFVLLTYGCVAEPADGDGGNASGSGGVMNTGGTAAGGVAGTPASGAGGTTPVGGTVGAGGSTAGAGAAPTGGSSGAPAGGAAGTPAGGTAGAGVSGAGGTPPAGGAGAGGTPASGAGGMPGGSGGGSSGGATGVNTDAMCKSISNNMPCTAAVGDGKACPMMPCGLGDMGRRDCNCATNWSCTTCSFVGTPIETRPANADTACGTDVVAGMPCATNVDMAASVCKSSSTSDPYCMCASDPRNSANPPEWNCDSKPGPWPM